LEEEFCTLSLKLILLKMSVPVRPDCNCFCTRFKANPMLNGSLWGHAVGFFEKTVERLKQFRQ